MVAAAQARGRVVGREPVPLEVVAEEHGDGETLTHEPPAGQDCGGKQLPADIGISERAGDVVVDAAAEHELEDQPVPIESVRRPQQAAMGEAALAPQVGGGEQQELRLVLAEVVLVGQP